MIGLALPRALIIALGPGFASRMFWPFRFALSARLMRFAATLTPWPPIPTVRRARSKDFIRKSGRTLKFEASALKKANKITFFQSLSLIHI